MPDTWPTARGSRLLGSALDLRRDRFGTLERARAEHGDMVRFLIGPPGIRIVTYGVFSPDGAHELLTSRSFCRPRVLSEEFGTAFGYGLLATEGDLWRRQRRILQPMFTPQQVLGHAGIMAEEAVATVDRWARSDGTVEAEAEMTHTVLRIVTRVLFGGDVDTAEPVIRTWFPTLNDHVLRRIQQPIRTPWGWPTPRNRFARRARRALRMVVEEFIDRRHCYPDTADDLLSRLLQARDPDTGEPMSHEQIRDEALVFLLAGYETTATALTFALLLLGQHPSTQEQLHQEVDSVLAGRRPSGDDLERLPYTAMVFKETLRLYPPAWALAREGSQDAMVDGHRIPAGHLAVTSPWVTHRHPGIWEDPHRFDPARFVPETEAARPRHAYFPFAAGPHTCIGIHFAVLESVLILATIAQSFRLHAEPGAPPLLAGLTMRPRDPVLIQVEPR